MDSSTSRYVEQNYINGELNGLYVSWNWEGQLTGVENYLKSGVEDVYRNYRGQKYDNRHKHKALLVDHPELLSKKHDIPGITKRVDGKLVE